MKIVTSKFGPAWSVAILAALAITLLMLYGVKVWKATPAGTEMPASERFSDVLHTGDTFHGMRLMCAIEIPGYLGGGHLVGLSPADGNGGVAMTHVPKDGCGEIHYGRTWLRVVECRADEARLVLLHAE
jgi:hypothetical protein